QPATAVSAAARISASGACRGSHWVSPAEACPGCSRCAGSAAAAAKYPSTWRGPPVKPRQAASGPIASTQTKPAAAGAVSHSGRHRATRPVSRNAAVSTSVSWASNKCAMIVSTLDGSGSKFIGFRYFGLVVLLAAWAGSAHPAGDVGLGPRVLRVLEDL